MKKRQTEQPQQFRQGDVLLVRVGSVPEAAKRIKARGGRYVLAYGELTGHAHAVAEVEGVTAFAVDDVIRCLEIAETAPVQQNAWECRTKNGETVFLPSDVDPAAYFGLTVVGRSDTAGVVLRHEEHGAMILTPGVYRHGGSDGQKMQREYTPEAIRDVTD